MRPEKYPLTWFTIRLMELTTEPMQQLNLRGGAQQSLNWFRTNSEASETYVLRPPDLTIELMRQNAIGALHDAMHTDQLSEDFAIIGSDLSAERMLAFEAQSQTSALATNSIKRIFERAEAVLRLRTDADHVPEERSVRSLESKAHFTDWSEGMHNYYPRLEGDQYGRSISDAVTRLFCDALVDAPQMTAPVGTPEELLQAIDAAAADLNTSGGLVVVLAGDWAEVEFGLDGMQLEGYEAMWEIPEEDRVGEIGRYRGHPIIRLFGSNDPPSTPHLYVVEVDMWGWFVDATLDPFHDLIIEFHPISAQRAQELLEAHPPLFSDQPDKPSKCRKLQTRIELIVSHRTDFLVVNSERARRVGDVDEAGQP